MRLLFVADGRSPTALSWVKYWIDNGHETHLISTFPCQVPPGLKSFHVLPVAFSGVMYGSADNLPGRAVNSGRNHRLISLIRPLRGIVGPLSLPFYRTRFRKLVEGIQPVLVHALRIPFEGMLASRTPAGIPLVISVWGNDITLHAHGSILMGNLTRLTLRRADGLIADAHRDIRLGQEWGFALGKPTLVVPGSGGVRAEEKDSASKFASLPEELPEVPIVINPRGQRPGSLRQDVFFQSIPMVLSKFPEVLFVCPNLRGDAEAERWVEALGIGSNTKLWPRLERSQMWSLYKKAGIFVSPSVHDGTPNSLLEAMANGCFPVVGNIESMQEWIKPGVNGLLVDAAALRESAKNENARIIAQRASYERCMAMAEAFYLRMVQGLSSEIP